MVIKNKKFLFLLLTSVFFLLPHFVFSANLVLSPAPTTLSVGQKFNMTVFVSSADQSVNAVSGSISFPTENLEVLSVSKSGSVLSLWVQEPSFSNQSGILSFEGIVLNPGFTGKSGKIISVEFRAKTSGSGDVNFRSGSVLANDGSGTNVLTSMGSVKFSVVDPNEKLAQEKKVEDILKDELPKVELEKKSSVTSLPPGPIVSSPTHPDSTVWYNNKNPKFVWTKGENMTALRLSFGKDADADPSVLYKAPILSEKQLENVPDGEYFFNARLQNKNGWGTTSHFPFKIDTTPPVPFVIEWVSASGTLNQNQPLLRLMATDTLSGLDHFEVKIGDQEKITLALVENNIYTLPVQMSTGTYPIVVEAYDRAGNVRSSSSEMIIDWVPQQQVDIQPEEKIVHIPQTDLKSSRIPISLPWIHLISLVVSLFSLLLFFAITFQYKLIVWKRRLKRGLRFHEEIVHDNFSSLKEDLLLHIHLLEQLRSTRKLTQNEEKILQHLQNKVVSAEKSIQESVKMIEKDVE